MWHKFDLQTDQILPQKLSQVFPRVGHWDSFIDKQKASIPHLNINKLTMSPKLVN